MFEAREKGISCAESDFKKRTDAGFKSLKSRYTGYQLTAAENAYTARLKGLKNVA